MGYEFGPTRNSKLETRNLQSCSSFKRCFLQEHVRPGQDSLQARSCYPVLGIQIFNQQYLACPVFVVYDFEGGLGRLQAGSGRFEGRIETVEDEFPTRASVRECHLP